MFFAIFAASFSSPKILIIDFKVLSPKLFITSSAEYLVNPIDMFNVDLELKENPRSKLSSCIDDNPKSIIASANYLPATTFTSLNFFGEKKVFLDIFFLIV